MHRTGNYKRRAIGGQPEPAWDGKKEGRGGAAIETYVGRGQFRGDGAWLVLGSEVTPVSSESGRPLPKKKLPGWGGKTTCQRLKSEEIGCQTLDELKERHKTGQTKPPREKQTDTEETSEGKKNSEASVSGEKGSPKGKTEAPFTARSRAIGWPLGKKGT